MGGIKISAMLHLHHRWHLARAPARFPVDCLTGRPPTSPPRLRTTRIHRTFGPFFFSSSIKKKGWGGAGLPPKLCITTGAGELAVFAG